MMHLVFLGQFSKVHLEQDHFLLEPPHSPDDSSILRPPLSDEEEEDKVGAAAAASAAFLSLLSLEGEERPEL